ncbi:MAG: ATP-grasp domain-containing protein [Desulforhopalus sp.]|nr:ATP-grasp domain-containing protein [Desulforhopalus sp.]
MAETVYPPAFVTYGWCRSAYTVVRSLAARGVEVHVGGSSLFAMSRFSRFAKSFTRLPDFFAEPEAYVEVLGEAIKRTGAKVLMPCFEDVELVINHRDRLPADVLVAVPKHEDWSMAEDKLDYLGRVAAAGCPVPRTYRIESKEALSELAAQINFPAVVKVRMGNGARGVEIVECAGDLHDRFFALVEEFELPTHRWPVVQEQLRGRKFKLDGVFCHGECVATSVFEILRCKGANKFGTSTFRVTVDEPELTRHAIQALKALHWHGMFNTDWICDDKGTAYLIDINGRLSGAVAVPYEAGMDLPWIWYQVSAGIKEIETQNPRPGVRVRWILGDGIGLVEHLLAGEVRAGLPILIPIPGCRHDDFVWHDPLPFLGQALDYLAKFLRARGSVRPMTKGMVR